MLREHFRHFSYFPPCNRRLAFSSSRCCWSVCAARTFLLFYCGKLFPVVLFLSSLRFFPFIRFNCAREKKTFAPLSAAVAFACSTHFIPPIYFEWLSYSIINFMHEDFMASYPPPRSELFFLLRARIMSRTTGSTRWHEVNDRKCFKQHFCFLLLSTRRPLNFNFFFSFHRVEKWFLQPPLVGDSHFY